MTKIKEGLQIPSQATATLKSSAKKVVVEPVMTNDQIKAREGTYFDDKDVKVYDEDVDIYGKDPETGTEKLLAKFRKNVLPKDLIEKGWEAYYITAAPSRNRGAAA